ncbi:hypothetical protein LOTGIDRAFT_171789 [Lottia gigantea]|uniref:Tryptophan 2,3-dioxygenase n=1 Tax=Lottia gigantea TaxID=225164 RepID=V4CKE4_LOTGI|nr:hypothetical protein LOTGIDRAFT_171789 [Lottia gigantea]ESP02715.1 hypothetical protein LOTGIDRAFT_171789 [Lottia gigantea]
MSEKINYSSYLKLGTGYRGNVSGLLDCVHRLSDQPEEHLFITVHHGFEIWFKQILFDFGRVKGHLDTARTNRCDDAKVQEELGQIPVLLFRSRDLLRNLLENFNIIETMGQLAFINFREFLTGGSGFQSHQFRMIENSFGLKEENRKNVDGSNCCMGKRSTELDYKKEFSGEQLKELNEALNDTIFDKIQAMLEDILVDYGQEKFIEEFRTAVIKMNGGETVDHLEFMFNEERYRTAHIERARHVNMVHRMIGVKVGTGGTSGYEYLSSTICDRYKVFLDLFVMSTYILPSKYFD